MTASFIHLVHVHRIFGLALRQQNTRTFAIQVNKWHSTLCITSFRHPVDTIGGIATRIVDCTDHSAELFEWTLQFHLCPSVHTAAVRLVCAVPTRLVALHSIPASRAVVLCAAECAR